MLKYEVQRLDGSTESILRAIVLILEAIKKSEYLPLSIEDSFIEEYTKSILNWVMTADTPNMQKTFKAVDRILRSDLDMSSPFRGEGSSKKRFGAKLTTLNKVLETYLRTGLDEKDYALMLQESDNRKRQKKLFRKISELKAPYQKHLVKEIIHRMASEKNISEKTLSKDFAFFI